MVLGAIKTKLAAFVRPCLLCLCYADDEMGYREVSGPTSSF